MYTPMPDTVRVSSTIIRNLRRKFVNYEHWLLSKFSDPKPEELPEEYLRLFGQKPQAYIYYRHAIYKFIQQLSGEFELCEELERLASVLQQQNSKAIDQFINYFNSTDVVFNFAIEWSNAFEISQTIREDNISHESCHFYQSKYEIDEPLLFLAILGKLLTENRVDLSMNNLRNRKGMIIKGTMIDYTGKCFGNFRKIQRAIEKAYMPKLRNTIGHNKYIIENDMINSLDNKVTITKKEFYESLYYLQELHNSIMWFLSTTDSQIMHPSLADCGVISIGFRYGDAEEMLILDLFQLWCFYEIDTQKNWLQKVIFKMQKYKLHTEVTDTSIFKGSVVPELNKWLDYIYNKKNVLVKIHSIIPFVGEIDSRIDLEWGSYQVTNESFSKTIPAVVTTGN
jgi:hypothetical protein